MLRKIPWLQAERHRIKLSQFGGPQHAIYDSHYGEPFGLFLIKRPQGDLRCVVSDGDYKKAELGEEFAWEHVSVSLANRVPTWDEMCLVKDLFWRDDECVVQYHPPKSEYKNFQQYTLHLWAPLLVPLPRPPLMAV